MSQSCVAIPTRIKTALLILIIGGCAEDPILKKARELEEARGASSAAPGQLPAGTPAAQPHSTGGVVPGKPVEPTPGKPGEPPAGKPGAPPSVGGVVVPGRPEEPTPGRPEEPAPGNPGEPMTVSGPRVEVMGTVIFPDWKMGEVRITAFNGDHQDPAARPKIIGEVKISAPGPFTLQVPENSGKIYIEAAVNEDMDGRPGPLDPQGRADRSPVMVGVSSVSGLTVTLTRREPPPGTPKKDDF